MKLEPIDLSREIEKTINGIIVGKATNEFQRFNFMFSTLAKINNEGQIVLKNSQFYYDPGFTPPEFSSH